MIIFYSFIHSIISITINDTNNLTIDYSVYVPIKEGYEIGDYLPVRIMYWFLDEDNTSCYNQGNTSLAGFELIEPYCVPLTVYTLGQMDSVINFTVQLRPSLPEGNYTIIRSIDIDPNQVWINYGQEEIGELNVQHANAEMVSGIERAVQTVSGNPLTGLVISDILNPINISLMLSMLAIGAVGLFSFKKKF